MATSIGTISADAARLRELVEFLNKAFLGGVDETATLDGRKRPTDARLVASLLLGLNTYADEQEGISKTPENGFFQIVSDIDREYVVLYQVVNGVAEEKKRYPSMTAIEIVENASALAQQAQESASTSAFQAGLSAGRSEGFAGQAQTASESSGNVRYFDSYDEAEVATLDEGQVVEIFEDETKYGRNTRYRFEAGALVYKPRNQSYSDQPGFGHSKYITEDPLYAEDSNYLLIGPDIYIEDGVDFVIPENTDVTLAFGTEIQPNV